MGGDDIEENGKVLKHMRIIEVMFEVMFYVSIAISLRCH